MSDSNAKPRLVIIDGYSLLFRAYLTPGPYFATSDGRPTGAVRGFANMLLSLLNQEDPDALYVAWDAPGKTFRDEKFEAYKAHRPPVADDLRAQFSVARQLIEVFGIASAEAPGFEADDLIGTLASRAVHEGFEVIIVSGDSDQLQLVGDGVTVRMTRTGVSDTEIFDAERVREKYGVGPEQFADYKALLGDTSDNIPGVPGIGKVTAAKLLQQYGTLDEILARIDDMPPGKVHDSLAANVEQAKLSRELATIHCEAPFEGPIKRYKPTADDWANVRTLFADLEFKGLAQRLPSTTPIEARESESPSAVFQTACTLIESEAELQDALAEASRAGKIGLRLHATGTTPLRSDLVGLAFSSDPDRSWYVRLRSSAPESGRPAGGATLELFGEDQGAAQYTASPGDVAPLLGKEGLGEVLSYNLKSDLIVLARHGLNLARSADDFDAMIAAYVLNPGRTSYPLADLAEEFLRVRIEAADAFADEEKVGREAAVVLALREPMFERIRAEGLEDVFRRIEMPLVPVLAEMERVGVPVDWAALERMSGEMARDIDEAARRVYELAGEEFNIGSTQQLQRILFEKLQLPAGKKIKTGYSTRADFLESLAGQYEIARRILEYRELTKLKSTYADALPRLINPETGRIHTSLNQTVAATGRLSSSEPNLQNIPIRSEIGREIRRAFIAPEGQVLVSCDYSQIELRVFAHVTKDPELVRAFAADEDIHAATAGRIFGVPLDQVTGDMRRKAKTVNFAVIYGQSDFGLANTLGIPTAEAREFIDNYFRQFPGVREYTERTLEEVRARGYVQTMLGRRRYIPEIHSGNFNIRQAAERAAVNMPIQGAAADIMKLAMIDVHARLCGEQGMCYNGTLLLQVHDELVFGMDENVVPTLVPEITGLMESAFQMEVPLRVDAKAGPNWADMSPLPRAK